MIKPTSDLHETIECNGFAIVPNVLSPAAIERLSLAVTAGSAPLIRGQSAYGRRNLLDLAEVRNLAGDRAIRDLVEPIVGPAAIPVRALFFDKTPEANWPVLWHQDLTIAVAERCDLRGWGPWSVKAGITHVEPPAALMASMLTLRLHLDDCHADNGPLRVIPGSHAFGRLDRERIRALRATTAEAICTVPLGAALLMRPLLLHASSPAKRPGHRRVIHIEYAAVDALPQPLNWAYAQSTFACAMTDLKTAGKS